MCCYFLRLLFIINFFFIFFFFLWMSQVEVRCVREQDEMRWDEKEFRMQVIKGFSTSSKRYTREREIIWEVCVCIFDAVSWKNSFISQKKYVSLFFIDWLLLLSLFTPRLFPHYLAAMCMPNSFNIIHASFFASNWESKKQFYY